MRRTFDDRLRRIGGRYPPLPASGVALARGLEVLRWRRLGLRNNGAWKQIEWAGGGADFVGCDFQVSCRCGQAAMTKQKLDGADVSPAFEKVNGKGMSHGMWGDWFRNAADVMRFLTGLLDSVPGDVLARDITRKQPVDGPLRTPPVAQGFQQFRREHNVSVFLTLPLLDANNHALAVNVRWLQTGRL